MSDAASPQPLGPGAVVRADRARRRVVARWVKRGALAAVAAAAIGGVAWGFLPKPVDVDTAAVRRGHLDVEVDEDGQTRVRDRFVVSAPSAGALARITERNPSP